MQVSNTLSNRQIYQKAYLVEFYGHNEDHPADIFTFSVPPESEELTYPQRKTEVKTFGGLHVDDYGADAVKINLSGSTINQSLKRIYGADRGDKWLSGEEEAYYFRDLMLWHKNIDRLVRTQNTAKILIYDLSKFTGLRTEAVDNCWQAFPGDYKIRRASDKPFNYKYTFEFTGIPLGKQYGESKLPKGSEPLISLQNAMVKLRTACDFINNNEALVNDVMGYTNQVSNLLNTLGQVMTRSAAMATNIMGTVGSAATGYIDGITSVSKGLNSVITLPKTMQQKVLSIGLDLQNAANRLVKATAKQSANCRRLFDEIAYKVPQEVLDQYAMNQEEFKDSIKIILNNAESAANEVVANAKSSEVPDITIGNPNSGGNVQISLSYGYSTIIIKDTDNFESLAMEYMGDPDKAVDVASFNNVASINELKAGDTIKIPITTRTVDMINNLIFARREDRDNYGRDIMLTDKGNIVASNTGDYNLINGVQNLTQAVLLRLRESNSKRIRITSYGIRKNISDPVAGIAYIISSIRQTMNNDPRIAFIDSIRFKGERDYLNIDVAYHDINKTDGKASGRI